MAQSARAARNEGVLDFVITSVMIIDHWGIVKADIGIKDGRIVGIRKAGNPDTMDGVSPDMVIGASTEVHGGAGLIATAGGIDTHITFYLSATNRPCIVQWHHNHDRWWNRPCGWDQCNHRNSRCMEYSKDAGSSGCISYELRFFGVKEIVRH